MPARPSVAQDRPAEPSGVPDGEPAGAARLARGVLVGSVILGALAISAGAAYVSFQTIRDLAELFGWPAGTAWLPMPIVETFFLVGSADAALRILEGERKLGAPYAAIYGALVATLAGNIGDHVLRLHRSNPQVTPWPLVVVGIFGAVVPTAQIGAVHFLSTRLRRIAEGRRHRRAITPESPRPRYGREIFRAIQRRALEAVQPVEAPPTATPSISSDAVAQVAPDAAGTRTTIESPALHPAVRHPRPFRADRPTAGLHVVPDAPTPAARSNAAELRTRYPSGLPLYRGRPSGRKVREDTGWSNDKAAPAIQAYLAGADLTSTNDEGPAS